MTDPTQPELSVVVAIVDGGTALRNCLNALRNQSGAYRFEVIIPYDQLSREAADLQTDFPEFRFLDLGVVAQGQMPRNALELHRFWDIRRAEGVKAARGRLIGMVEDRGIPREDWVTSAIDLQRETGAAAVGGCVDNGHDTAWNWAVHICDFSRYMPPVPTSEADFLSATNVCYRADILHQFDALYQDRFYEPAIHAAMQAAGHSLMLSDQLRTTQYRPRIPTGHLFVEWFHWGRYFARSHSRGVPFTRRLFRAAVTPLLPFVLFARHYSTQRKKQAHLRDFWKASPLIFLIVTMWALGELAGYVQGPEPDHA